MAGLFDIGSSGIAAYRKALNVTGQNIANLNTEGYRRRDVSLTEISGSQGGITAVSDQSGLGVRAQDVTRAFDSYVAERARDSQSDFYEIEALNTALSALEDVVVPQDYDLTFYLNTFFSALGGIGQSPGDLAPRISALEQAGTLATGFSETANNLENLRQAILAQAEQVTSELNTNIKAMQTMQSQLLSSGQGGSAPNAMLDERDRLVLAISDLAGLSVEYGSRGDVTLTLGETLGGPKLIDGLKAGQIGLDVGDGRINVMSGKAGSTTLTQQLSSGRLSGLLAAYEAVSLTIDSLDVMAQKVVTDLNAVHSSGLTLDGQRGQAMFSLSAASVSADGNNLGQIATSVDDTKLDGESNINLQLIFDAKANLWRGYDSAGNEQVSGTKSIAIGGLSVVIDGKPADGDILMLRTSQGAAANMKFLLTRPEDFAAAGLTLASADSKNSGTGDLTATMGAPLVASTLRPIDTVLTNSASAMSATRLLKEGAITSIPATATSVELFSLARQDSVSYTLSPAEMSRA
ncbi:MAG: flagellar hook-associated protein FlgK, partial [Paracoccaceae bacterium]|nr:flagellar hook-associated protein FlgK [Paracoccaceae bacterium]